MHLWRRLTLAEIRKIRQKAPVFEHSLNLLVEKKSETRRKPARRQKLKKHPINKDRIIDICDSKSLESFSHGRNPKKDHGSPAIWRC
jgi:hypothetical protein